jgi:uncharacterized protein (TIGR02722 family)
MRKDLAVVALVAVLPMLAGCAAFRISVEDKDPEKASALSAKYDQADLLALSQSMSQELLSDSWAGGLEGQPRLVEMGIQNRTKSHIDTRAISETITTKLLDSGKIRLIDAANRDALLKEQGYQLANCSPETRVTMGKQLGARYMLTGSLVEIERQSGREVRVSRKQDVYYQLTMQVTDLESGEVVVRKQQQRLRRASKPLIGW